MLRGFGDGAHIALCTRRWECYVHVPYSAPELGVAHFLLCALGSGDHVCRYRTVHGGFGKYVCTYRAVQLRFGTSVCTYRTVHRGFGNYVCTYRIVHGHSWDCLAGVLQLPVRLGNGMHPCHVCGGVAYCHQVGWSHHELRVVRPTGDATSYLVWSCVGKLS